VEPPVAVLTAVPAANPVDLVLPPASVCVMRSAALGSSPPLSLGAGQRAFGNVSGAGWARVHVGHDALRTGVGLELAVGPVQLNAIAEVPDVRLFPRRQISLGGVFIPAGTTPLRIAGVTAEMVTVEPTQELFRIVELAQPLTSTVPCASTSLEPTKLAPRAFLGPALGQALFDGDSVAVSTESGELLARIELGPRSVDILERGSAVSRIAWSLPEGVVTGWVDNASLRGRDARRDPVVRMGPTHYGMLSPVDDRRRCAHDLALGVSVDDDAAFVGKIAANAVIEVLPSRMGADWSQVRVPSADVAMSWDAELFVRSSDLASCKRVAALPRP
jgi:hypothetical protein